MLCRTLDRMTALEVPADVEWELLIVNNNRTDERNQVVESFTGRLPIRLGAEGLANLARLQLDPERIVDRFEALVEAHVRRRQA